MDAPMPAVTSNNKKKIFEIYAAFSEESAVIDFACHPGCATCCTRNVTLTTAEGELIMDFLRAAGCGLPQLPMDQRPLRPPLTTNGWAALCLSGKEAEAEAEAPWLLAPCFLLRDGLCTIYPVRPFACRGFGSTVRCGCSGVAEAPEWFMSLAMVSHQILEDLDRGGWWGNLADILAYLGGGNGDGSKAAIRQRLLRNQPMPGLLVLPEERPRINRLLARIAGGAEGR